MAVAVPSPSIAVPAPSINVLVVDDGADGKPQGAVLSAAYRVTRASNGKLVCEFLQRWRPELVVADLQLRDGQSLDVCRATKAMQNPPVLLVTTADVTQVPDALDAGCDGVLLKPFAPNLLISRVSHLLRQRSQGFKLQTALGGNPAVGRRLPMDTNGHFPNLVCPFCNHIGITSFDHSSLRRDWFACLGCRKVWLAKRQEH